MTIRKRKASITSRIIGHRRDVPLLFAASLWLFIAWLTIDVFPFRLFRGLLHPPRGPARRDAGKLIESTAWAVAWASRHVPWRTACFHEGIAALQILQRRGVPAVLHYGVKACDDARLAHVWVSCNSAIVVGGTASALNFTEIARFDPPPRGPRAGDEPA